MKHTSLGISLVATIAVALLSVAAGSAPAAVGVGHAGWSWGNPLPQGEQIDSLDFAGNRGYAAGKFGTLLRSDDAGATWAGIATGITQDLAKVSIIDGDSLVIAGGCAARRSDNAGQTFKRLPWTVSDARCSATIVSLDFPVDQIGFLLLSDGSVLRTANGGTSWSRKTALPATKATGGSAKPTDIAFVSPTVGVAVTDSGRLYRTIDGGNSWTLIGSATRLTAYTGLYFVDAANGYAIGAGSTTMLTNDGGQTWVEKTHGSLKFTGIRCAPGDIKTCLVTTDTGDRLIQTADGFATNSSVTPSTDKMFAAALTSATHAVAAGQFGTTVVSNDVGATWATIGGRLTPSFTRIRGASEKVAYVAGKDGAAAKTVDGGKTWVNIAAPASEDVIDLAFPTTTTGYALDDANGVSRTADGGSSWQILNPGTPRPPQAIAAASAKKVVLVGPRGISRSTDGGGSFARVRGRRVSRAKLFDADTTGSTVFAYGARIVLKSTTAGRTWSKVRQPRRTATASLDFVSKKVGFMLSQDGRVWKTRNGGKRWVDLIGVGTDDGVSLSFSSSKKGYLVVSRFGDEKGGYLLRTRDGGNTWQPQLLASAQVTSIGAAAGTDYALAGDNQLFFTNSGGNQGARSKVEIKTKRKKVKRRSVIKVTGKVSGAQQGEQVLVARRFRGETGWDFETATIAANGTFTTSWKIRKASNFIAQFAGDADHSGSGSRGVKVGIKKKKRR